jgi:hypothetical protein
VSGHGKPETNLAAEWFARMRIRHDYRARSREHYASKTQSVLIGSSPQMCDGRLLDLARFGEKNENWPVVVLLANRRVPVEVNVEEASASAVRSRY